MASGENVPLKCRSGSGCQGSYSVICTQPYGTGVRRRRECRKCGHKEWTLETFGDLEGGLTPEQARLIRIGELVQELTRMLLR